MSSIAPRTTALLLLSLLALAPAAQAVADVTIDANLYDSAGTSAGTTWDFGNPAPGAINQTSTTYVKASNAGDATGTFRVDLGASFTGPNSASIPTASNIVFEYGAAATPDAVVAWTSLAGGADAQADVPVEAGATVWVRYTITALPALLPDGAYATTLDLTVL